MKKIINLMLLLVCFSTTVQAKCQGVVVADKLNVRDNTSLTSNILEKINENERIEVIDIFGEWYKINTGKNKGFVKGEFISLKTFPGYVDCDSINVRTLPDVSSEAAGYLVKGNQVEIIGLVNDFYKIDFMGNEAYVYKEFIKTAFLQAIQNNLNVSDEKAKGQTPLSQVVAEVSDSNKGESIKAMAYKYLGNPYSLGGEDLERGVDCSSFTQQIYAKHGISIPRKASEQAASVDGIPLDRASVGDLVFFSRGSNGPIVHVGIYIGNNQMIHAGSDETGIVIDNIFKMGDLQLTKVNHY